MSHVIAWKADELECRLVFHLEANSYEVQLREHGAVMLRRWCTTVIEAHDLAVDLARAHGIDPQQAVV